MNPWLILAWVGVLSLSAVAIAIALAVVIGIVRDLARDLASHRRRSEHVTHVMRGDGS